MTVTGLHHASLTVTDLERSLRFYRDLLGVGVRDQIDTAAATVTAISVYRRLMDAGVTARSEPILLGADAGRHWDGCVVVWITDPDGATVELVQPRET